MIYNRYNAYKNEVLWVVMGSILVFLGGIFSVKILTNIMTPNAYGQLVLGLTIVGVLNTFIYGPLGQSVLRYHSIYHKKKILPTFYHSTKLVVIRVTVVILLTGLVATLLVRIFSPEWALLTFIAIGFGVLRGILGILNAYFTAKRHRKIVALNLGMESWLKILFSLLIIAIISNTAVSVVSGYIIAVLLVLVVQLYKFRNNIDLTSFLNAKKGINHNESKVVTNKLVKYSLSFTTLSIFTTICLYSDKWMLNSFTSVGDVGIYAVIQQIANVPIMLLNSMTSTFITPIIFSRAAKVASLPQEKNSMRIIQITAVSIASVLSLSILSMFYFSEWLVVTMTSETFSKHHNLLWILASGYSFSSIAQILFLRAQSLEQPKAILPAWVIRSISFVILSIFLSDSYGIEGMAYAFSISSSIFLIATYLLITNLNKKTHFKG